jgi:PAS domain S-box-containing protein
MQESIVRTVGQLFVGLRFRLVLLVVLASLPPVLLTLHVARQDRQRQTMALRQRSHDMIQLAARKEDEMIAGTRQLLRGVAESSQVQSARWSDCTKLLRTLFADYPRYANLGVIKANGEVQASALPLAEPVNLADRSFFQRALATRNLSIGDYQVGRITGKPSFNLGYPVLNPSGQVEAVVFAALDLDWLSRSDYALQKLLPEGATWTKIDSKGTILARYPESEKWLVGEPLPETPLLQTLLARKNGVMEAVDPKGISVFYDFTSTRSVLVAGDVINMLSIPRQVLFAEPDRVMVRNLTSVGIVAGLVLLIGWVGSRYLVLRPIEALVKFTGRLGAGDHSARTGSPRVWEELRQLMRAFDQMAEALQQREAERELADTNLRASEMRYRRLFETAQDGILILNADTGQIDDVNPFLTNLLGYTREELLGHKLWEIGPFRDTKASKAEFRELQREAYTRYDDLPLETSDGRAINVEFVSNVYQVNGGKVIQCNIRDITKRKRAEEELRANEIRLRGVVESTADGLLVVDRNGRVMIQNGRFREMWRIPTELMASGDDNALLAHAAGQLSHPEDFLAKVRALYDTDAEDMDELRFKDGRFFERFSRALVLQGAVMGRVWSFRDVTQRKRGEGRLKESRQRLQTLSRRLVKVQETERRHLARELHDEIGQALTVAELNLQAMLQLPGTDALAPRLKESLAVVDRVLEQVHDLSLNLRPSILDDLGLEAALRWYTDRQAALAGLQAEVRAEPLEQRLDPTIETECFRVAQEAVNNVVKHAKARTVIVELTVNDRHLLLSVRDDGVGFDVDVARAQASRGASLGLLSMEERATLSGGGLMYLATPAQGTEVRAWFPLKWAHPAVLIGAI